MPSICHVTPCDTERARTVFIFRYWYFCRLVNFLIFLRIHHERLEIEPTANSDMDFSKIVKDRKTVVDKTKKEEEKVNRIESKEDNFIDDPDVPPLIWDVVVSFRTCTYVISLKSMLTFFIIFLVFLHMEIIGLYAWLCHMLKIHHQAPLW